MGNLIVTIREITGDIRCHYKSGYSCRIYLRFKLTEEFSEVMFTAKAELVVNSNLISCFLCSSMLYN